MKSGDEASAVRNVRDLVDRTAELGVAQPSLRGSFEVFQAQYAQYLEVSKQFEHTEQGPPQARAYRSA